MESSRLQPLDRALPTELLLSIFRFGDDKDRCHLSSVNRHLHYVLYNAPELWKRLDLSNRYTLGGAKFLEDSDFTANKLAALVSRPINPETSPESLCSSFMRFTSLARLDLSCTGVNLDFFATTAVTQTALCSTLLQLIISGCPLVGSGNLYQLRFLKSLSYLDISHCDNVDDFGLEVIGFFLPWIKELNLAYLFKITEAGVKRLLRVAGLRMLNLMGCCESPPSVGRVKSYPWAIANVAPTNVLPLRELSIGEDSRIQTRGWGCVMTDRAFLLPQQHWDMQKLSSVCPFLETIRLNMVLFDLPENGLQILLEGCKNLKVLSLVVERTTIPSLCSAAPHLRKLKSLDLTIHIGVQSAQIDALMAADALPALKALKFHSKHTTIFTHDSLQTLAKNSPQIEYLELNGDELRNDSMISVVDKLGGNLQSLLMHHMRMSNAAMKAVAKRCCGLRDLTITDLQTDSETMPLQGSGLISGSEIPNHRKLTPRELSVRGLGPANQLKWLVSEPGMGLKLKKIELSSFEGFSDKDLALIPSACPGLQLSANAMENLTITSEQNINSIDDILSELVVSAFMSQLPKRAVSAVGSTTRRVSTSSEPRASISGAKSPRPSAAAREIMLSSEAVSATRRLTPFLASLKATQAPGSKSIDGKANRNCDNRGGAKLNQFSSSEVNSSAQKPRPPPPPKPRRAKKGKGDHLFSSQECQALMYFATFGKEKSAARKLRVLDLSGSHGLSDYILSTAFASGLTNLHTLFLDGCDNTLTETGVVKFAESRWKSLKRMHIRNCRGVSLNTVQENFLSKGLEVDVVIDGGRLRGLE
ncbi:hypothetical protein HDU84_001724 [Entophlyctis sp. JEL0112]|nr:hypothetical protein HDU84_001724 [Entophlyctis sp. JEL0112]